MAAAIAVLVATLCGLGPTAAQGTTPSFYEIETKYIFGFTEGSGVGLEGEKEVSIDTIARLGKRDGRYAASETKFEFEYTPNQYIQLEMGALASFHHIRDVTDLDNRNSLQPSGLFGEIRYLLLDRPSSPVAVTLTFEPTYRAVDETTGGRVVNYEFESKINADVELIKNRVYAAFNAIYEPEVTREEGQWIKESKLGVTAALAGRVTPEIIVGAEIDYYRHYDGILFNTFTGDALFIGPTLYVQLARKMFMTAAWNTQVWGREVGNPAPLNLAEFSRHRAKLKVALEF